NDFLWVWQLIGLLLGTHLFLTVRSKVIQRFVFRGIQLSLQKEEGSAGDVSPFGALTTALASTFGTGNIIGVGTAIALGGPGAVFWCWLTGVFGIATTYGEALLAVKFRVSTADGKMQGGAMYVLDRGLHMRWLAILFAIFGCAASFGIGCAVQVNAIAAVCKESLNMPSEIVGIVAAGLAALVIFGGIRSIAGVCERLVPFMSLFYIGGCGAILIHNYDFILPALRTIVTMAFSPGAAAGGLTGGGIAMAMRYGIARGLFSNEAGMGSAPIAAAAAKTSSPVRQALVSSTATFWDTVVVCAITGLVLVSSIMKNPSIDMAVAGDGGLLTTMAFAQIPIVGPGILVIGIITFAFSTILGWAYYGECCIRYLTGRHGLIFYRVLYILTAAAAPVIQLNLVWMTADVLNALMVLPNLVSLLCMSDVIVRETRKYLE
ncbi:alanine/glycine:cation symporter family protein, partial [Frisingicoccus sp.]|uniref:alanine/glycine:cation symporter family protein n=1 Tax=Frisingicoccus sp. TaxID=1918627 RepID=UPI003991A5A7